MLRHFPNSLVLTLAGKIASYWLHIIVQCTLNMVLVTHYTVYKAHFQHYLTDVHMYTFNNTSTNLESYTQHTLTHRLNILVR